jgi:hypothetical protein
VNNFLYILNTRPIRKNKEEQRSRISAKLSKHLFCTSATCGII